ncbi:MAG: hypothetical protein HUU25_02095 [Candidatus Sumerlaeia bacterium]|nr:hypothetical protein [Candidatus Sumerlaeia bacterium]
MMRRLFATAFALAASAALAAPATPEAPAPTEGGGLMSTSVPIPSQTLSGWYERGNPEREADDLEIYLKTLVWGNAAAQSAATGEGRLINVDLAAGAVAVTDSQANIERIMSVVDPGLDALRRRQILSGGLDGRRVSTGISSLPADAGAGLISRRPRVEPSASGGAGATSATARRTLRQDDEMSFRGLRITLIDVFEATAGGTTGSSGAIGTETRTTAVLLLETQNGSTELEVQERRSVSFENFRIRILDAESAPEQRVTLEVTDLEAQR